MSVLEMHYYLVPSNVILEFLNSLRYISIGKIERVVAENVRRRDSGYTCFRSLNIVAIMRLFHPVISLVVIRNLWLILLSKVW